MSRLLIVAATVAEAAFLSKKINRSSAGKLSRLDNNRAFQIDLLITGVGITATTYHLTRILSENSYDLAINIGICGSLDPGIKPVRIVNITEDRFADFGSENGSSVISVFEAGIAGKNDKPFTNGILKSTCRDKTGCLQAIPKVKGITVQLVHGTQASVRKAFQTYGPVMESMEGAAFFYVCRMEKIPCLQIRAVSNRVEKRNRDKWKVKEAIDALAGFMGLYLMEFQSKIT